MRFRQRVSLAETSSAVAYIAGDWRTAKLMISTLWGLTAGVSLSLLLADWWKFKRQSIANIS